MPGTKTTDLIDAFVPPHNIEAEMCALGSMLLSERAASDLSETLSASAFYSPAHAKVFDAMVAMMRRSQALDLVTLRNELIQRDALETCGGIDYLIELAEAVPSAANAEYYAGIVMDMATLRNLESAGQSIVASVRDTEGTAAEKVEGAERAVFEVGRKRLGKYFDPARDLAKEFFDEVDTLYETGQPVLGVSSGFVDFDSMTGGLYPGDLLIIAARPAMGKTSLVMNMALNVARRNVGNVAVFSLEMSGKQLVRRMVSTLASVPLGALRRANLETEDYQALANAAESLYDLPLFVDDTSDISPVAIRAKCRRLKANGGLAMVVVDYLQLLSGKTGRSENRQQEISEIARSLKSLAKELEVPLVALSQLNRGVESREDKRPNLSDLRESGSIEAEADLVAFIYRREYYAKKDVAESAYHPQAGEVAELIVGKHRNGPTGRILLAFHPAYTRFSSTDQRSKDDYLATIAAESSRRSAA